MEGNLVYVCLVATKGVPLFHFPFLSFALDLGIAAALQASSVNTQKSSP